MSRPIINNLRRLALLSLGAFLIVMLGANSVAAAGGPLTWLTFWQLPSAGGDLAGVGPVILLPVISVVAWALYLWQTPAGDRPPWNWGSKRITLPALALWLWAIGRGAWQCLDGLCPGGTIVRLIILAAVFFWVYLLIANERPDLLWVVAPVLLLQSTVAIAQFVIQRDLGLQWLGELELDPAISGVSVVMNGGERWLRGYGLTIHPNTLARLLVVLLIMLPVLAKGASRPRQIILWALFGFGVAGLASTLSRWAWVCLLVGLAINAFPTITALLRRRTLDSVPRSAIIVSGILFVILVVFLSRYGGTVMGRLVDLGNPLEARSIFEHARDIGVSLEIIQQAPLTGVGPSNYEAYAVSLRPDAILVHSVPLLVGAELGLVGLALWSWLLVWPLWRRGSLGTHAPTTAMWVVIFLLGLFYFNPYPLNDTTSGILIAIAAGYMATSLLEVNGFPRGKSRR